MIKEIFDSYSDYMKQASEAKIMAHKCYFNFKNWTPENTFGATQREWYDKSQEYYSKENMYRQLAGDVKDFLILIKDEGKE